MSARNPISSSKDTVPAKEIPDFITDTTTGKKYEKGKFLGKVRNYYFTNFYFFCLRYVHIRSV